MQGYKCELKIDVLIKLREEFWGIYFDFIIFYNLALKIKQKPLIWKALRLASLTDHIKSENILKQHNLQTLNGCINKCKDNESNIYNIPNFCINDPFFEKEILPEHELDFKNPDLKIKINLYDLYANKTTHTTMPSNITGLGIKQLYADLESINIDEYKIRLLFGGGEIKDEEFLYQHKIHDDYTIQVIKNKLLS
jgi:hypothetical protein